jgi:hypothetical protein
MRLICSLQSSPPKQSGLKPALSSNRRSVQCRSAAGQGQSRAPSGGRGGWALCSRSPRKAGEGPPVTAGGRVRAGRCLRRRPPASRLGLPRAYLGPGPNARGNSPARRPGAPVGGRAASESFRPRERLLYLWSRRQPSIQSFQSKSGVVRETHAASQRNPRSGRQFYAASFTDFCRARVKASGTEFSSPLKRRT